MKARKIKLELDRIENDLIARINLLGVNKSATFLKLKQPDISAWIHGRRNWTYNKILDIADKLGL